VNSFGFGGTNAHAILENFLDNQPDTPADMQQGASSMIPYNFSAMSEKSLIGILSGYAAHIQAYPSTSLRDLSWTVNTRRSDLPVRISISAQSTQDLVAKLEEASNGSAKLGPYKSVEIGTPQNRILGVFTGQGAQWATMGSKLLQRSKIVVNCFAKMQRSLDTLSSNYRPTWSLSDELMKAREVSMIEQVEFSQPICTAVQIALVDLLRFAGVKLAVVVGHSSGEIAAAYAAGYLRYERQNRSHNLTSLSIAHC
jgi:hybrid polyketide synthase/nonribosomal peptide synthetase ACE1